MAMRKLSKIALPGRDTVERYAFLTLMISASALGIHHTFIAADKNAAALSADAFQQMTLGEEGSSFARVSLGLIIETAGSFDYRTRAFMSAFLDGDQDLEARRIALGEAILAYRVALVALRKENGDMLEPLIDAAIAPVDILIDQIDALDHVMAAGPAWETLSSLLVARGNLINALAASAH